MHRLIKLLKRDYPHIKFEGGTTFSWSPGSTTIIYKTEGSNQPLHSWSLLHELAHALLGHSTYSSDLELLLLEAKAWHKASQLGETYSIKIDEDHVQDCLDTYRDWLHKRSTCPTCANQSLQTSPKLYECYNCGASWQVSAARFCRPYRKLNKTKSPELV